jgi:hypothetical protein
MKNHRTAIKSKAVMDTPSSVAGRSGATLPASVPLHSRQPKHTTSDTPFPLLTVRRQNITPAANALLPDKNFS